MTIMMMRTLHRLIPILSLSLGFHVIASAAEEEKTKTKKRPNIVLLVSDDMGWSDVGYHGSKVDTPNIDRIGAEGVELDRFYVFPICSPTRTALMTGRSPIRFGIVRPLGGRQGVPTDEHFLPQSFQAAGYQTLMTGKWHLGKMGEAYAPESRGFDHFYGFRGGVLDYYKHTGSGGRDWQRNGVDVVEEGYTTDLLAAEAVKLLKGRNKAKPVFLYVPFNAPHGPAQAPKALVEKYQKRGLKGSAATRAACIDAMDQAIGKILRTLDSEKMTANTLVMFFCDNGAGGREIGANRRRRGGPSGAGDAAAVTGLGNAPLKRGKGSVFEGGIRVPAVLRWASEIKPGSKCDAFISVLDLPPTLAAAAGIQLGNEKPLDGFNVWPVIRRGETVERPPIVVAGQGSMAILDDPWKLVQQGDETMLYQVKGDPSESTDLSAKHAKIVERLKAGLVPYETMLNEKDEPARGPRGRRGRGSRRQSRR